MKVLILTFLILSKNLISQTYPVFYSFNSLSGWTVTNGSGIQNNSGDYCLSTNIGTTPYPNSSIITMTSPNTTYTNCVNGLSVSFPLSGIIERNYDYMYFEYYNGSVWTILGTYTDSRNTNYSYVVPNTARQFRFRLVTDNIVNTYSIGWTTYVYYYDICSFTINCINALPIELVYFNGQSDNCVTNVIYWSTISESNNDYFDIEKGSDGINFIKISQIKGNNNSNQIRNYSYIDNNINNSISYYRLKQVNNDGSFNYSKIIDIDNTCLDKLKIVKICNILGQEVSDNYYGVKIYYYNNGSVIKKMNL